MTTQIVGLVGPKRSGKDTAACALIAQGWRRVALADPMRDFMLRLDPLIAPGLRYSEVIDAHGYEVAKDTYPEVRELMKRLGTEAGRYVLGENVWTDIASLRIATSDEPVVVTDVRFINEADILRRMGGLIVRVVRPDLGRNTDMHQSETEQEEIRADYTLINGGTPEDLWAALLEVVSRNGPTIKGLAIN